MGGVGADGATSVRIWKEQPLHGGLIPTTSIGNVYSIPSIWMKLLTDIPRPVYWFASSVIMWWFGWFWFLFSGWCVNFSIDADEWIANRVFNYKSWISAQCLCLLRFWQCFIHSRRYVSRLKTLLLVQYGEGENSLKVLQTLEGFFSFLSILRNVAILICSLLNRAFMDEQSLHAWSKH